MNDSEGQRTMSPDLSSPPWALREYAVLADGERGAVLDPRGRIVWLCAPRWHDDAVFSALVGGAGHFAVEPADPWHVWGGSYEEGTLIRVSRWVTADCVVECREALALPARPDRLVLLRRMRVVRGEARLRLDLDPRPGFGSGRMHAPRLEDGVWTAGTQELRLRLAGAPEAVWHAEAGLRGGFVLREGDAHDLVLELARQRQTDPLDADALWAATEREWRQAVPDCSRLAAPRDARHAYAVLRGLTSSSGGMVGGGPPAPPPPPPAGGGRGGAAARTRPRP
ncbi:trehalase-like domain-containing protein, partial [Streptomyces olivaceus]|uniref:trehalase-like domain-containing protein n=1 Tax=Streptomyces olivaceus TaxID=47716 RepID=UPI004055A58A